METQKPGNSPRLDHRSQRVAKERAVQRVRSWTVQNKMRDVQGQVSEGAAGRILDSVNPEEVRT